ncbi:MAG: hypothetical protein AB3X44_13315 [Leptothrix sp. (in: b-proteobacteria)]
MNKAIPWVFSVILACALGVTWFAMHAQLEQKDAELSDLRGKCHALVIEANQRLDLANKRYNDLVADANQKINSANQREVEVQVSFRKAIFSSGNVAILRNVSSSTIAIAAIIERPASGQSKTYDITLDPNQFKEISGQEGWSFIQGDTIKVSQPARKGLIFTAP